MGKPLDLYYWPTPNGHKITIFLEEVALPYNIMPVNIGEGEQFTDDFLAISPNNKMPAIVDYDTADGKPISIFESGAILLYLAEKTGRFLPADTGGRFNVIQWLMFQMASVGPMLGQAHHFRAYATEKIQYGIDRYTNEAGRIYSVIDKQLAAQKYIAGDYSIADMAIFPWLVSHERQGQDMNDYPNLQRWYEMLKQREAVRRGLDVMREIRGRPMSDKAKEQLFGAAQYKRR